MNFLLCIPLLNFCWITFHYLNSNLSMHLLCVFNFIPVKEKVFNEKCCQLSLIKQLGAIVILLSTLCFASIQLFCFSIYKSL